MNWYKCFFEFYLRSSLHVSISVWSLYRISFYYINSSQNYYLDWLVFSSSVVGYNMIKFTPIFIRDKKSISKSIFILIFSGFISGFFCFFYINLLTQIIFLACFVLVFFYSSPTFFKIFNLRSYSGLKIFIVALVWTLVTYLSLIIKMNFTYEFSYLIFGIQRFIFVFVLIIPFDIRDTKTDKIELKTIPQALGIFKSKLLGISLLIFNATIFYFTDNISFELIIVEVFMYLILSYALMISNSKKNLNFTRFWVEGIPIIWFLILFILRQI